MKQILKALLETRNRIFAEHPIANKVNKMVNGKGFFGSLFGGVKPVEVDMTNPQVLTSGPPAVLIARINRFKSSSAGPMSASIGFTNFQLLMHELNKEARKSSYMRYHYKLMEPYLGNDTFDLGQVMVQVQALEDVIQVLYGTLNPYQEDVNPNKEIVNEVLKTVRDYFRDK